MSNSYRLKRAYLDGVQNALRKLHLTSDKEENEPSFLRKAAPWLLGGAAGLGAYKYLRTPALSKNPMLRRVQTEAARKGFHRIVDVTHNPEYLPSARAPWLKRLMGKITAPPMADPTNSHLDWANKLKLWLREGGEAIPVTAGEGAVPKQLAYGRQAPGKTIKGITYGRHATLDGNEVSPAAVLHGGKDLEGTRAQQKALTALGVQGKGNEYELLRKHVPDAMPRSITDLSNFVPEGELNEQSVNALKERLSKEFGGKFLLKPHVGLTSGGDFPFSDQDWGAHVSKYQQHIKDPAARKALSEAAAVGDSELSEYLGTHGLLPGYTLENAIKNPKSVLAQQLVENPLGEFRVHTMQGEAPRFMQISRWGEGGPIKETVKNWLNLGDVKSKHMKAFAEDVLNKLPAELRSGSYGMDVMPFKRPDGSVGFKIIEMNPTEMGGVLGSPGGGSGLVDTKYVPHIGHAHYRAATGRHTTPVSALGGIAAGGLGTAAARAALRPKDDEA